MNEQHTRAASTNRIRPESSFGVDPATGIYQHPAAAPYTQGPRPVKGSLDYLEDKEYIHNMTVEGRWPELVIPGVSFQNIIDMNGRRYMYHYYRARVNVYDITEPKNLQGRPGEEVRRRAPNFSARPRSRITRNSRNGS